MKLVLFLFTLLQFGCATKYILPGNRFMTPESQGGSFESQFEFQQASANQLTADVSQGSVTDGVTYQIVRRSGFSLSTAFLDQLDLFWNHTGSANSMLGAKFQFLGASRTAKGTGHKMAISAAFGGNEHETDGENKVEFELSGQEFQLLYGYRFSELVMAYSNLSYARYSFLGSVSSTDPVLNGLKPEYESKLMSLYGGVELTVSSFFGKLECGYQRIKTTYTKDESHFIAGYSLGVSW